MTSINNTNLHLMVSIAVALLLVSNICAYEDNLDELFEQAVNELDSEYKTSRFQQPFRFKRQILNTTSGLNKKK